MEIYYILLFLSIITGVLFYSIGSINNRTIKILYCCVNYIPLAIVAGVRNISVGTDTPMYHYIFYDISRSNFEWTFFNVNINDYAYVVEIGYRLLNKVISFFTLDENIGIMLISIVTILGFAIFFFKTSYNIWITTVIFIGLGFYVETFNTMRQVLACMIICNGFVFFKNKLYKKWILTVLIATTMHFTAIVFLGFTKILPLTRKKLIMCISFLVLVYFFVGFLGSYISIFDFLIKYESYNNGPENILGLNDLLKILLYLGVIIVGLCYRKTFSKDEKSFFSLCSIFLIFAVACTLLKSQMDIFYRFVQYFSIYICLLAPFVLEKMKKMKYIFVFIMVIVIPMIMWVTLSKNPNFLYSTFL